MAWQRSLRVGTRGSRLALIQTERAVDALRRSVPGLGVETVVIVSSGDRDKTTPLSVLGGQGVFAKELHEALLDERIDVAVHSVKDLPSTLPDGIVLAAVVERSDPRDVLVSRDGLSLDALPQNARIGTSSRRRQAAVREARPDLTVVDIRGNVDTRLLKVDEGEVDAVVLAATGLLRLGWEHRIAQYLPVDPFVPAPGQGALGITCRIDDLGVREVLARTHDPIAGAAVEIERAFLRAVGAGCQAPVGAYAAVEGDAVTIHALLGGLSSERIERRRVTVPLAEGIEVALALARELSQVVQTGEQVQP